MWGMMNKCKHGRNKKYCCECCYGKIRMGNSRHIDVLDELTANSKVGYKLLAAYSMFNNGKSFDE